MSRVESSRTSPRDKSKVAHGESMRAERKPAHRGAPAKQAAAPAPSDDKRPTRLGSKAPGAHFEKSAPHRPASVRQEPSSKGESPAKAWGQLLAVPTAIGGVAGLNAALSGIGTALPPLAHWGAGLKDVSESPADAARSTVISNALPNEALQGPAPKVFEPVVDTIEPGELSDLIDALKLPPIKRNKLLGLKGPEGRKRLDRWLRGEEPISDEVNKALNGITSMHASAFKVLADHLGVRTEDLTIELSRELGPPWDAARLKNAFHKDVNHTLDTSVGALLYLKAKAHGLDLFGEAIDRSSKIKAAKLSSAVKSSIIAGKYPDLDHLRATFGISYRDIGHVLVKQDMKLNRIFEQPLSLEVIDAITEGRSPVPPPYSGTMLREFYEVLKTDRLALAKRMGLSERALIKAEAKQRLSRNMSLALSQSLEELDGPKMTGSEFAEYLEQQDWTDDAAATNLETTPEMVTYARLLGSQHNIPGHLPRLIQRYKSMQSIERGMSPS